MAIRGRKPKPTALKRLEGNLGRRPLNSDEPVVPSGDLKCPRWLLPAAKVEWKRLVGPLTEMGILTQADMAVFAAYCQAYARWKEAEEFITEHGSTFETPNGYIQQRPQVSIAANQKRDMLSFCAEFGLTPSARSRIVKSSVEVFHPNARSDDDDEMELLLRGG